MHALAMLALAPDARLSDSRGSIVEAGDACPLAVTNSGRVSHRVLPTLDPREEPGALAAHAGICAGGGEQSSSLPRSYAGIFLRAPADDSSGVQMTIREHGVGDAAPVGGA